ncbi:MAG: hypothetical protein EOM67_05765 [Spirochaetia bacterium]|nr:hypothetical protein [Spirochaetia bacterium]
MRLIQTVGDLSIGSSSINLSQVTQKLDFLHLKYESLGLNDHSKLLIVEKGGRILGPFNSSHTGSLLWMNQWWDETSNLFSDWNIGGERLWIAPELQYNVTDRSDIQNSYSLPREMDPSHYSLKVGIDSSIHLDTEMKLETFIDPKESHNLTIKRRIKPIGNPLKDLIETHSYMKDLSYSGYSHTIELESDALYKKMSEPWIIMQVRQGGISIVPTYSKAQIGWYYRPTTKETIVANDRLLIAVHDKENLFKIGLHSTSFTGRVGYLYTKEEPYLIIRNYFVSPHNNYVEEPFSAPKERGYAFHLYNSGVRGAQFGEVESQGASIGGPSGQRKSTTHIETYIFEGKREQLERVAQLLLSY